MRDAISSVKWAIDAVAYDVDMAKRLIDPDRLPDDPDLQLVLQWAREAIQDRELARHHMRCALRLLGA